MAYRDDDPYGVYGDQEYANYVPPSSKAPRADGAVYNDYTKQWEYGYEDPTAAGVFYPTGAAYPTSPAPATNTETPTPPPPTEGGNDGGGGGGGYDSSGFIWPQFTAPRFDPGDPFVAPPPFSYDPFKAPTLAEAQNEPGYAFARDEGIGALEASKAAQGILRTGGTLKDILKWGNRFAEQNYSNVYNRSANTYDRNRNNAADNYRTNYNVSKETFDTNYGIRRDKYDRDFRADLAEFDPKMTAAQMTFDDLFRRWATSVGATSNIASAGATL